MPQMKAVLSFAELHAKQNKISQGHRAKRSFTYLICVAISFLLSFLGLSGAGL